MIKELDVPGTDLWKYVDDTTISETIRKNQASHIQAAFDSLASRVQPWISSNYMRRNAKNCL